MKAWQDLVGGDLTQAEESLIEACLAREAIILGDGSRPKGPMRIHEIRAPILKALIIGGLRDQPTTDFGVALSGAYISGLLNLSFCRAKGLTSLSKCRFEYDLFAMQAQFELLNLSGSYLPALNAQGARVAGSVFLRHGFHAKGQVTLLETEIGGQLSCEGGRFENPTGIALFAQGARVAGSVFLRHGFHAKGQVSLSGAEIGGQLSCVNGTFEKAKGVALNAQHLTCKGALVFRAITVPEGDIDFSAGHVGALRDRVEDWPEGGRVILDGFTYDRIIAAATTGKSRLNWLSTVDRGKRGGFKPQPYTQLAKVLRNIGHERGARDVLVARDRKIAAEEWKRAYQSLDGTWSKAWVSLGADFRAFINFFSHLSVHRLRPPPAESRALACRILADRHHACPIRVESRRYGAEFRCDPDIRQLGGNPCCDQSRRVMEGHP